MLAVFHYRFGSLQPIILSLISKYLLKNLNWDEDSEDEIISEFKSFMTDFEILNKISYLEKL